MNLPDSEEDVYNWGEPASFDSIEDSEEEPDDIIELEERFQDLDVTEPEVQQHQLRPAEPDVIQPEANIETDGATATFETDSATSVSYTHLTLPTKRIV